MNEINSNPVSVRYVIDDVDAALAGRRHQVRHDLGQGAP